MTGKEKYMASMAADVVDYMARLKEELEDIHNDPDTSYSHSLLAMNR